MSRRKRQSMVFSDSDSELENIGHRVSKEKPAAAKPKPAKKKPKHQPETVFVESDGEEDGNSAPDKRAPAQSASAGKAKPSQAAGTASRSPKKAPAPVQKNTLDKYFCRMGGGAAGQTRPSASAVPAPTTSPTPVGRAHPKLAMSPSDFFSVAAPAGEASVTAKPAAAKKPATAAATRDGSGAVPTAKSAATPYAAKETDDDPDVVETSFVAATPPRPPVKLKRSSTAAAAATVHAADASTALPEAKTPEVKRASFLAFLHRDGPKHLGETRLPKAKPNALAGMTIVITGVLDYMEKELVESLLLRCGAKMTKSVSKRTSMLVVGREPGASKLDKARQAGVKCPLEKEFYAFLGEKLGPPEDEDVAAGEVEMLGSEPGGQSGGWSHKACAEDLKSGGSKTHSAEEALKNGSSKTHSADGTQKGGSSKMHSAEETQKGGSFKTHSAVETQKGGSSKMHSAAETQKGRNSKTHSAEETQKDGSSKVHSADETQKGGSSRTHSSDETQKGGSSKVHSADGTQKGGSSQTHSAEKTLKGGGSKTHSAEETLNGGGSKIHSAKETQKGGSSSKASNAVKESKIYSGRAQSTAEERQGDPSVSEPAQLMWVDKYRPRSLKQVIGQTGPASCAAKLHAWLSSWHRHMGAGVKRGTAQGFQRFNDDGSTLKAALLSGPPGIGKTTTATLACRELGFECLELNASDTRNKRSLHEVVGEALGAFSVGGMFGGVEEGRRRCVIMDEVDGMSGNEDRGGVAELIQLIRTSHVPIICICNDRNHMKMRSLGNYCYDLRFPRPRPEQIRAAALSIASREGLKLDSQALLDVIAASNNDVRQTIHNLQAWTSNSGEGGACGGDQMRRDAGRSRKDLRFGPFDLVRKALSSDETSGKTINELADMFFQDYNMEPLFVQENYPLVEPDSLAGLPAAQRDRRRLELLSRAADAIALGDVCSRSVRAQNNWGLLPVQAVFSSVLPGRCLSGRFAGQVAFPAWLGRNSTAGKTGRQLALLAGHLRLATGGLGGRDLGLDMVARLADGLTRPLRVSGAEGVPDVVSVLDAYDLLREDMEAILELAAWPGRPDPMAGVDPKVKAALTRAYNKAPHLTPYSLAQAPAKRVAASAAGGDEFDEEGEGDGAEEEAEADESDPATDAMIKKPKKPSKPATAGASAKASGAGGAGKRPAVKAAGNASSRPAAPAAKKPRKN